MPELISKIQMVRSWIVEVDGLLHEAQAQGPRVEVQVLLGVAGNGRNVVDPEEPRRFTMIRRPAVRAIATLAQAHDSFSRESRSASRRLAL